MQSQPSTTPSSSFGKSAWPGVIFSALIVFYFYFIYTGHDRFQGRSAFGWLKTTWNSENDFEHGFLVPIIIVGLLSWQWKNLVASAGKGSWLGYPVMTLGVLLFAAACRTGQPRLAIYGLPMVLWGSSLFLWGFRVARLTFFPLFLLWLAVPLPQFQQATTKLQILSTYLAQHGCKLFGVNVQVMGTKIISATNAWAPLEIDEGCGGIRSLMALIMISSVWAYVAKMSLWRKALLCLTAFPFAVIGNMLRLTSIFVISEYGSASFAKNTWHDWSGLLFFYPISLLLLFMTHSLLDGSLSPLRRLKKTRRVVTTRQSPAR
jgi:exosortase